ncbi:unnamed protein product [Mytilus coruscus]|uniref:B box-type domain-containing protein n=1 Tax=Mytilus coruscus TaxID=42192 RepID=A0A6J8BF46_MYTCO|nr:unnamed protein product [Mytilus coruscus]
MATNPSLARSMRKEQASKVCELCENEPKLKFKCLECGLMMCQRCCDKVHPKFPSAKDHTVLDIKDIKCIAKTHKRHRLIEFSEGYDIKLTKIRKGQENINSAIHSLTDREAKLCNIQCLEQASYQRTRKRIRSYEKVLSHAVKEHVNKLLNEVDQKWEDVANSINNEKREKTETRQTLITQKDMVNNLLQSHDVEKVFSITDTFIQSTQQNIPLNKIFNHVPEFVPGDKSVIPKLVGSLKSVGSVYNPVPKVIQQYTTNVSRCFNLFACSDGSFWLNDYNLQQVLKVIPSGEVMKVISNFNIEVEDISLMSNGELLLCLKKSPVIKVTSVGSKEVKDFQYNVSPLWAISVHVTHENKVMVGVKDTGQAFPASGPRQIIVIDQTGEQEQVFEYDNNSQPLFTVPGRIHSNKANIVGVLDWISEDANGRIVVLDKEGILVNIYTGHPKINSDIPFKPYDILFSPSENFLIVEPNTHFLHILNSHGNILTFYNLKGMGIKLPYSISCLGDLFIGGATYIDSEEKVIVYKVDNFVW